MLSLLFLILISSCYSYCINKTFKTHKGTDYKKGFYDCFDHMHFDCNRSTWLNCYCWNGCTKVILETEKVLCINETSSNPGICATHYIQQMCCYNDTK